MTLTLAEMIATRLEELAADVRRLARSSESALAAPLAREQGHESGAPPPAPMPAAKSDTKPRLLLPQRELAQQIGVSARTLQRMRHERRLPAPVKLGGRPRWRRADIERWIEEQPSS